jgi:hypothetical protein
MEIDNDMMNNEDESVEMNASDARLRSSSKKQVPITQIASLPVPMPMPNISQSGEVVSMTPDELVRKAREQMEKLAQMGGQGVGGDKEMSDDNSSIACSSSSISTFTSNTTQSSSSASTAASVPASSSSSSKIKIEWKKKK